MTEPELARAVDALKMLWEEYRYRHELCWRVSLQTTVAAVILSTLPYSQPQLLPTLGREVLLVPALGIALTAFAMINMARELKRFLLIRTRYRELQFTALHLGKRSDFEKTPWFAFPIRVQFYLAVVCLLQLINGLVLWRQWIPSVCATCS